MPAHSTNEQAQKLVEYIINTDLQMLPLPSEFFYASLPICVVDAVYSINAFYKSTQNVVNRFCNRYGWKTSLYPDEPRIKGEYTISKFLDLVASQSPDEMANDLYKNRQRTSTKSGILKAEAVREFARALSDCGIDDFMDLEQDKLHKAKCLIKEIPGQRSGISFGYFCMLAGNDKIIKPDRMVLRYIAKALETMPDRVSPAQARELLNQAVNYPSIQRNGWTPRTLDYAIWSQERD